MSVSTTEGEKCHVIQVTKEAGISTNWDADSTFVFRGGPNSELFLSDLRKLLKRDTAF